jgi:hypothetical protein
MTPDDKLETAERIEIRETPLEPVEPGVDNIIVDNVVVDDTAADEVVVSETVVTPQATLTEIDRKVPGGMFAVPEIVGLAASGLVLLIVLGFYFLALAPAQRDLKAKKAQRDDLEKKLTDTKLRFGDITKTEVKVASLIQSVDDFESRFLPISSIGRTALYDRLNGLMRAYGLRNTAGPEYTPLETKELKPGQPQQERGRAKFESLFPGDYINMTVEGSYVNMRRFIREIEASQQFVVISAIELEAAENKPETINPALPPDQAGNPNGGGPGGGVEQPARNAPKGKTHGEIVSLHLELAAYFRREAPPVRTLVPAQTSGTGK